MEIRIASMSVEDAAKVLEDLSLIMQDSIEHGELPSDLYAGAFEVIGALAAAIKEEARDAA